MSFRTERLDWLQGLGIAIVSAIPLYANISVAQITPDGTLPNNSNVRLEGNTRVIEGGTIRGANLFHSFSEFSVPIGSEAFFNNALDIENILTRVTGSDISNINGSIRALGKANLFLINPNGIIFGKNAQLKIGGSFLASTASSLKFADGVEFYAKVTQTTSLLTISVPTGLQYGGTAGSILNQSTVYDRTSGNFGLVVQPGNTLALVGGSVSLDGGGLTATGGRVELGGVTSSGRVDISVNGNDLHLNFPNEVERADVFLTKAWISANSLVQYSDGFSVPVIPAGSIIINARNIDVLEVPYLSASAPGSISGQAGEITLNAKGTISVTGTAKMPSNFTAYGIRGLIKIKGKSISLADSLLSAGALGGYSGDIFLQADESLSLANSSILNGIGYGKVAGDINLSGRSISITGTSQINTFGTSGVSGNININALDSVSISGTGTGLTQLNTFAVDYGRGGDINIKAGSLVLSDGARLNAGTSGNANAGNIVVIADSVTLSGVGFRESSSGLFTNTDRVSYDGRSGKGGDIRIEANSLRVLDKAVVSAKTQSDGNGGNITVNTNNLEVTGGGQILTTAFGGGSAGNITVNSTNEVTISGSDPTFTERSNRVFINPFFPVQKFPAEVDNDGSASGLLARVQGNQTANAGNIEVTSRSIHLNNGATLSADTKAAQGNITLNSRDLVLSRGSNIKTDGRGANVIGGNININADVLVGFENSDISANSTDFRGGNVTINTKGVFGIQFRDISSPNTSDITASGATRQLNGNVQITTPDVDPTRGLVELPINLFDASTQISTACTPGSRQSQSSFVSTGRGGLPMSPTEPLQDTSTLSAWVKLRPEPENLANTTTQPQLTAVSTAPNIAATIPIVEASGWVIDRNGNIELVAQVPQLNPHSPWQTPADCLVSQGGVKYGKTSSAKASR